MQKDKFSSKPILVTGATGSIGSFLVRRLAESGQRVRALVRNPDRAASLRSLPSVEFHAGDLAQPGSLRGCAGGCSIVYHLAAKMHGSDWASSRAVNITGTQALIDESFRAGVDRFVYASTIGVYGLAKDDPITEETPWTEYNLPYFTTKQEAERIVWKSYDRLPVVVARIGDAIGPGQTSWSITLLETANRGLLKLPLDSQTGTLNPIYIDNLIDALLLLGTHPTAPGQIFNVVDGFPIRSSDYFRFIHKIVGKKATALPFFLMKGGATVLMWLEKLQGREPMTSPTALLYQYRKGKIYPEKMKTLLGWSPTISKEEAFRRTEDWLRQQGYLK